MAEVNIVCLDERFRRLAEPLRQKAAGVFKFLGKNDTALEIYLTGAVRMREVNREYRGKDSVTDVLAVEPPKSFPQSVPKPLGEIYLNPPCIRKKGYSLEYALIHGILHLLGFDHERKSDKIEMEKQEKKILQWLTSTF